MAFPVTKRYWVSFRHSDTGLSGVMSFSYYKRADTLANIVPQPTFTELSGGTYYFDVTFTTASDPDIVFEIDGGVSIPTEEIRYKTGLLSPKDNFIDGPLSQVSADVWNDTTDRAVGTKGNFIESIGASSDNSAQATLFGKILLSREQIRGDTAGTTDGNDVEEVFDRIGAPTGASIAADLASVVVDSSLNSAKLTRALGMMHENSVLDQTAYDGDNNLTAGRYRIYTSKANALAAGLTGLIATYTITATYIGGNLETYSVVIEP